MFRRSTFLAALGLALSFVFAAPTPGAAEPIRGSGSTFAGPAIAKWAQNYRAARADGGDFAAPDWTVDYELVGSLGGVLRLAQPEMDFGATDAPLPRADLEARNLLQFPLLIGGVAVVANLDGFQPGQLRLSGEAIADIYLGKIVRWNAPEIAALNPGLTLPDTPITIIHRRDGSGTTQTFTEYLAVGNAEWKRRYGADVIIQWPFGTPVDGSRAMVERLRATRGAIGYVEYGQVRRAALAYVSIRNAAGAFVRPTQEAFQAAARSAPWSPAEHFFVRLTDAPGADAYPITAATFALVRKTGLSAARTRPMMLFFRLALESGGSDIAALGYVPLPDSLVGEVAKYWRANSLISR